jgi:hypothetical protein
MLGDLANQKAGLFFGPRTTAVARIAPASYPGRLQVVYCSFDLLLNLIQVISIQGG